MNLHSLKPANGSIKKSKRIGRGQGSGKGGTSTKGHKGAQSRSGYKTKVNSEGGQMPLQMRTPKFGFNNPNKIIYKPINLSTLQLLSDKGNNDITKDVLINNGLINKKDFFKILGDGELKSKVNVSTYSVSKTAKKSIESLGGKIINISKTK